MTHRFARMGAIALAAMLIAAGTADAASLNIVALGASNTAGKGVGASRAFPAQLQALLRKQGHDARVSNAGINGDTTAGMLARLEAAVPGGTQVVILQPGGNDARRGRTDGGANIATIESRLRARGIKIIVLNGLIRSVPAQYVLPDGQHLTAAGHALIAARLVPQVIGGRR